MLKWKKNLFNFYIRIYIMGDFFDEFDNKLDNEHIIGLIFIIIILSIILNFIE